MRFFLGFVYAFRGMWEVIKSEQSFRLHLLAFVLVVVAGFHFRIQPMEWISILMISSVVLGLEAINTSLERLCDELTEERRESIRIIKDIAAGAVLISAIGALVIAVIIFRKYLI